MGTWDVTTQNGRTVVKKHHPFWNGVLIGFAVLLALACTIQAPWAAILFVLFVVWAVSHQKRKTATSSSPSPPPSRSP